MASKILRIFAVLLVLPIFLFGFALLTYPVINNWVTEKQMENEVGLFLERRETPSLDSIQDAAEPPEREYAQLWDAMVSYNDELITTSQAGLEENQFYAQHTFSLREYGLEDEVFGLLQIPRLDLSMPIYLGATDDHLAFGAAHLSGTSLPIGGDSTCTVIAGHRGWNGAAYFRYVPDLQLGDTVSITNLWETMTYSVVDTQIIDPNDVDSIRIQPGRERLILLTCHPYASGGKQRFLVSCERVTEEGGNYEGSNY